MSSDYIGESLIVLSDDMRLEIFAEDTRTPVLSIKSIGINNYQINGNGNYTWSQIDQRIRSMPVINKVKLIGEEINNESWPYLFQIFIESSVEQLRKRLVVYETLHEREVKQRFGIKIMPYLKDVKAEKNTFKNLRKKLLQIKDKADEYSMEEKKRIEKLLQHKPTPLSKRIPHVLPKVKLSEKSTPEVENAIYNQVSSFYRECDYENFEKNWNDPNYGPVVATMIYLGCIQQNIPTEVLKNRWQRLLAEINTILKTIDDDEIPFVEIYRILAEKTLDYQYCNDNFNFLVDYYEKGICNCECGTYLAYELSRRFPGKKRGGGYYTMPIVTPNHIQIYMFIPTNFEHLIKTGELQSSDDPLKYLKHGGIRYETTFRGGAFREISDTKDIIGGFFSEQVMAFNIMIKSFTRDDDFKKILLVQKLVGNMLDINWDNDIYTILTTMNRKPVKTLLDSNYLDMCILTLKDQGTIYKQILINDKKYILNDMVNIVSGKFPTQEELRERVEIHAREYQNIQKEMDLLFRK